MEIMMLNARQISMLNKVEEPKMRMLIKYPVIAMFVAAALAFSALLAFAETMVLAVGAVLAFAQTMSNAFTVF
jgi:hypothetical protein